MPTTSWNASNSDNWSNSADWSNGTPNSTDVDADISIAGTYTVDIANGDSFTVNTLTLNDAGATLQVDGTLVVTTSLSLTAGTLDLTGTMVFNALATTAELDGLNASAGGDDQLRRRPQQHRGDAGRRWAEPAGHDHRRDDRGGHLPRPSACTLAMPRSRAPAERAQASSTFPSMAAS